MAIPNTYEQAQRESAVLYREVIKHLPEIKKNFFPISKEDCNEEYRIAHHKYENYCKACYSLPWIRPFMKAWMVDVKFGNENPFSDKEYDNTCEGSGYTNEEATELIEMLVVRPDLFTAKTAGNLASNVRKFINNAGFNITDSGGGGCGGHIGVPCTDDEAQRLINLINHNFSKAIQRLMSVVIAWFKPKFFGNDADAAEYVKKHLSGNK